jgi:hypothetical protein
MMKSRTGHTLLILTAVAMFVAAFGVSSAMAAPKGEYAVFSACPLSNAEVDACLAARTESGEIKVGNQGVPIVKEQILQAGLINRALGFKEVVGATLSKTPQKVPGGLLGIKCSEIKGEFWFEKELRKGCEHLFEHGLTGVYATTELAGPVALSELNLEFESGTALSLPVKVKLENTLLGEECYIGSSTNPIKLELTSGTSGTLKGKLGTIGTKAEGGILAITNSTLVDSGFSAPAAEGCGLFGLLDGIINSKLELPATKGNTATLNGAEEIANSELVQESEG